MCFQKENYIAMYSKVTVTITPGYGAANVTVKNRKTWDCNLTFSQDLENPEMHIDIYGLVDKRFSRRFFKVSFKTCNLHRILGTSPFLRVTANMLKERSNMSLECPMPAGKYYMRNMGLETDLIPLALFYTPNSTDIVDVLLTAEKDKDRKVTVLHTLMETKILKMKSRKSPKKN